LWLHSLKAAQLLRSAACLHTNQSRSYLNHLVFNNSKESSVPDKVPEILLTHIYVFCGGKYLMRTFHACLRSYTT